MESLQFVMQFCFTNFVYLIKNIFCFLLTVCAVVNLSLGGVCVFHRGVVDTGRDEIQTRGYLMSVI